MNKIIVLCLISLLTACGFQPLYAKKQSSDNNVIQKVQIYPIGERTGQILYNRLNDIMNPYGNPSDAEFKLRSSISISSSSLGVQADDTTTRKNSTVNVKFTLTHKENTAEFSVSRTTGYNESDNAYSTSVAENDAVRRNLEEIAEDAKIRIAALIKRRQTQDQ
ncbi:LPS assembly lipoprotein LptE [Curvivirga aplysinae]|uniref:LPS assembly lipoprotein LptE n=1 Tax=Curvivirga aplysinae TaxID=2529852 RepID=UPI0012BCB550|nr:LPS assembly lipoprotein LptE [Curvivirga aplysinae]MTI09310.1 hypothetical protein [Curvivirga aplysinae]